MTRLEQTIFVAAAVALTAVFAVQARLLSLADPNGFERCARVAGTALEFALRKGRMKRRTRMNMLELTKKLNELQQSTAGLSAERRAKIARVLDAFRTIPELASRIKSLAGEEKDEILAATAVDGTPEGPEFLQFARNEAHLLVDQWFKANVGGIWDLKAGPNGRFVE